MSTESQPVSSGVPPPKKLMLLWCTYIHDPLAKKMRHGRNVSALFGFLNPLTIDIEYLLTSGNVGTAWKWFNSRKQNVSTWFNSPSGGSTNQEIKKSLTFQPEYLMNIYPSIIRILKILTTIWWSNHATSSKM